VDEAVADARDYASRCLGPIYYAFCHRLWLHQYGNEKHSTRALFAARGGLRLLALYRRFLSKQNAAMPVACEPFMISRLAAAVACFNRAPGIAMQSVLAEFHGAPIRVLARALLPDAVDPEVDRKIDAIPDWLRNSHVDELSFHQLLNVQGQYVYSLHAYLHEQGSLFDRYLAAHAQNADHLIICDTGLFASTQALLMASHPEYHWTGLYFARSNYRRRPAPHHHSAFGLIVDRDIASVFLPETCFLRYWHLCEMPLEPELPTVTHYLCQHAAPEVVSSLDLHPWREGIETTENPHYLGIVDYFERQARPLASGEINVRLGAALKDLQRRIYRPSLSDVKILRVGTRPRDFGRVGKVGVLTDVPPEASLAERLQSVAVSLWKEGQVRIAFPRAGMLINWFIYVLRYVRDLARLAWAVRHG